MRVLHLSSGNLFGGVETFLIQLARSGGTGRRMESHFALTEEGRLSEELVAAGAQVHRLGAVRIRNPVRVRRVRRNLRALVERERFDCAICHSSWAHALFAATIRRSGIPLAFYLHGHASGRHWLELLARRTPPDLVLTNSHFTGSTSKKLFPDVRCEVVRCPVPTQSAAFGDETRTAVRTELETPESDVVIVQTSRLEAWKGHRLHLEALAELREVSGWTCWMVGGAQRPEEVGYLQELKRIASSYGIADRVRFPGQRDDVPRILSAADIHCQPNLGPEPFGIVFIEALYAGLPVVTTDLGGPREIVVDSCGRLTPPGDAAALARVLCWLITDSVSRKALGAAGPARALELCDPDRQISRLAEALASIAAPGHAGSRA